MSEEKRTSVDKPPQVTFKKVCSIVLDAWRTQEQEHHNDQAETKKITTMSLTLDTPRGKFRIERIPSGTYIQKKSNDCPFGVSVEGKAVIPNDPEGHRIVKEFIISNFPKTKMIGGSDRAMQEVENLVKEKFFVDYVEFCRKEKDWLLTQYRKGVKQKENHTPKSLPPEIKEVASPPLLSKTDNEATATSRTIDGLVQSPTKQHTARKNSLEEQLRNSEKKLRNSEKKLLTSEKKLRKAEKDLRQEKGLNRKLSLALMKSNEEVFRMRDDRSQMIVPAAKKRKCNELRSPEGDYTYTTAYINGDPYCAGVSRSGNVCILCKKGGTTCHHHKKCTQHWEKNREGDNLPMTPMKVGTGKNGDSELDDDEKIRADLSNSVIVDCNVDWDDVVGLPRVKRTLKTAFVWPLTQPQLYQSGRKFSGVLMYGPPGTGKTFLAMAAATAGKALFINLKISTIVSQWAGRAEKTIAAVFKMARESKNGAVMFFDEVDGLCMARSSEESQSDRRIKNVLLGEMDGMDENEKVLVLGATSIPWELDEAFLWRFQKRVYIPLPEESSRVFMFKSKLRGMVNDLNDTDYEWLGRKTEGASGADIKTLVTAAKMELINRAGEANQFLVDSEGLYHPCESSPNCSECPMEMGAQCPTCSAWNIPGDDVPREKVAVLPLVLNDFQAVMNQNPVCSVSTDTIQRYEEWNEKWGASGK